MHLPWSTLNEDPSNIGCAFPAHQTMGRHYDYDSERSVYKIPRDRLADFEPDFSDVIFERQAKHLDLIASAPIRYGWIVSDRFLQLLSRYKLPPHRAYPLPVIQGGRAVDGYSWLHLPQPKMSLAEDMSITEAELEIMSHPEAANGDLLPIYFPVRFGYFFITHRLRQAIEAAELTGIRFSTSKLFRTRSQTVA